MTLTAPFMDTAAVCLDNLTVSYRSHPALHHLTGYFPQGSLTAVVGPNGSGKSTLLKSIMGLMPIVESQLTVLVPHQRIAYLPQVTEIDRSFPISVRDCVLLGCWHDSGAWGMVTSPILERINLALTAVGLQGFENRNVGSLSGGQLQRALFARLLVQDADLFLLDEPFNAVDTKTLSGLLSLIHQWHGQKRTIIAVLHDDAIVRAHFPNTLMLARELVAWGKTEDVLTEANLRRSREMTEAWDDTAAVCHIDTQIAMSLTSPHTPLKGVM